MIASLGLMNNDKLNKEYESQLSNIGKTDMVIVRVSK
jgi:hypothetical protein